MKILITTPTGIIGRKIVPELLAPEFLLRVITSDPSLLPQEIRDQMDIVRGAIADARLLRRALEGMDALFWSVPHESIPVPSVRKYYGLAHAAAFAIREAGIPRVVSISECSTSDSLALEDILNQSGAAIRHIRCGFSMDHLSATVADNIADMALRLLVRTDWSGIEALSVPRTEECPCGEATALIECDESVILLGR